MLVPYSRFPVILYNTRLRGTLFSARLTGIKNKKSEECFVVINLKLVPRHLHPSRGHWTESWLIFPFTGARSSLTDKADLAGIHLCALLFWCSQDFPWKSLLARLELGRMNYLSYIQNQSEPNITLRGLGLFIYWRCRLTKKGECQSTGSLTIPDTIFHSK